MKGKKSSLFIGLIIIVIIIIEVSTFFITRNIYMQPELVELEVFGHKIPVIEKKHIYEVFLDKAEVQAYKDGCINPIKTKWKNIKDRSPLTTAGSRIINGENEGYFLIATTKVKGWEMFGGFGGDDVIQEEGVKVRYTDYHIRVVTESPFVVPEQCRGEHLLYNGDE